MPHLPVVKLRACWWRGGQVLWTFSIYLEAVAILPQLVLLQRTQNIDNLTGNYVFLLGCAHECPCRLFWPSHRPWALTHHDVAAVQHPPPPCALTLRRVWQPHCAFPRHGLTTSLKGQPRRRSLRRPGDGMLRRVVWGHGGSQDVPGAVHPKLDLPLLDGAQLPAVDRVGQRRGADGAVRGLLLLLRAGVAEQQEAAAALLRAGTAGLPS